MKDILTIAARVDNNALVRRETFEGRQHLIVPVVPIVEGVLNDFLVTQEEIAAYVEAWNGIPLPVGHPRDHQGAPISANSPQLIEQSIGRFFNARMDGPRLLGELWIDITRCHQIGGDALQVLRRLEEGQPLEVSTAFWSDDQFVSGEWNGRPFIGRRTNLRPDHLALLPNDVGACCWEDG